MEAQSRNLVGLCGKGGQQTTHGKGAAVGFESRKQVRGNIINRSRPGLSHHGTNIQQSVRSGGRTNELARSSGVALTLRVPDKVWRKYIQAHRGRSSLNNVALNDVKRVSRGSE